MNMSVSVVSIVSKLCSVKKLERDSGLADLQHLLPQLDKNSQQTLQASLLKEFKRAEAPWEALLGSVLGSKYILQFANINKSNDKDISEFKQQLLSAIKTKLPHLNESRVLVATGDLLGMLCNTLGPSVYLELREQLLGMQKKCLMLKGKQTNADHSSTETIKASLHMLQAIIEGCGCKFVPHIDQELFDVISIAFEHKSQSVREAAFYLVAAISNCCTGAEHIGERKGTTNIIFTVGERFLTNIAEGLADEWSPIRLAASVAVRRFLLAMPSDSAREKYYPVLLPRMCLNRYYSAEGVRNYSQETWRQVAGCSGRELVQEHLTSIVEFYSKSAQSPSHTIREAACSCLAELATKLQPDRVRPHVKNIFHTLLGCFADDSWPVRDAACLACGSFVISFPKESTPFLSELYPSCFRNLEDAVPTVRTGAAAALASVVKVHSQAALPIILNHITHGLEGISTQPSDTSDKLSQGVCSTLTPKLGRSSSTDHHFHRSSQPWELADGCVILVTELATIPSAAPSLPPVLPLMATACTKRHYSAHLNFLETVCKHLPTIAKGIGKKNFKIHVDNFLEPIFYALESENSLTSSAASQCLNHLSTYLGSNVLRARVQANSPSHLQHLDANLFIAPF
ncbi:hypothetical protein B566_EDAN016502 [Ephemera danica]|nr:hypothetical protein B566_EDAN016502 [Ephemera danica]